MRGAAVSDRSRACRTKLADGALAPPAAARKSARFLRRSIRAGLPGRPGSGAQALTTACATGRDDLAAAGRFHAGAESVPALAHELARLIGPFHGRSLRWSRRNAGCFGWSHLVAATLPLRNRSRREKAAGAGIPGAYTDQPPCRQCDCCASLTFPGACAGWILFALSNAWTGRAVARDRRRSREKSRVSRNHAVGANRAGSGQRQVVIVAVVLASAEGTTSRSTPALTIYKVVGLPLLRPV